MLRLYDTATGAVEDFTPRTPGRIDMYVCGPTVYGPPHLGHARTTISFDMIRRAFAWLGFDVTFVSNYTDIDDKIIRRAAEEGADWTEVAARYEAVWVERMHKLRVLLPDRTPRATEHVDGMLEMIGALVERGAAYPADGDVYFSVESFPAYGRLSHQNPDDLLAGARVEPGEHKRAPVDFALWKAAKPGEPAWPSPWGPGRPGWHIECSVMATDAFGSGFDVHGGGSDLIFPHHENEIAQAEAATGAVPFARCWMHSGMVNLEGEKMSKSTGHFVSLDDLLAEHRPEAIRLLVAQTHYRNQLDFSPTLVAEAEVAVDRLVTFRDRCVAIAGDAVAEPDATAVAALRAALEDDVHTPAACAALFDLVKRTNTALDRGDAAAAAPALAALGEFDAVLAVVPPVGTADDDGLADALMQLVLELRERARAAGDWPTADHIRDRLTELEIVVEDTAQGTRWRRGRRQTPGH